MSITLPIATTHKPTNPFARRTGLLQRFDSRSTMKDATEIIPDHLWQSSDPSPELLKEIHPNHIVDCRWFDDDHGTLPTDMAKISAIADSVAVLVRSGCRVLVHCTAGINRSSLIICLSLMRLHKDWTGAQCVRYLETLRPGILTNQLFRSYLMALNATYVASLETQP